MARVDHLTGGIYRISTVLLRNGSPCTTTFVPQLPRCSIHRASAMSLFLTSRLTNAAGWGASSPRHLMPSLMAVEETTASLFPSDLFIQPNDQPAIVKENLGT